MRAQGVVPVAWLASRLTSGVRVIDASWYLPAARREPKAEFASRRIPGARFFDLDLTDDVSGLLHQLPSPTYFGRMMASLGVGQSDTVVCYDTAGMIDLLGGWIDRYPIISIEDPLGEDDPDGFKAFTKNFGHRVQVIGDDFLVTNAHLINQAVQSETCNSVLIKPNQAGTITETKEALQAARNANWPSVVSARSGETEDTTIAHLAVGWKADQFKVGSFARSERMAKWNEMLRIEKSLGANARLNTL